MSLPDKIRQRSQPLLEPGEQIQVVAGAHTVRPLLCAIGWLLWVKNDYTAIVATDRRIVTIVFGRWTWGTPTKINEIYPRSTRLGPVSGFWHEVVTLDPHRPLWVYKRFHPAIEAADQLAPTS
jgi:hypothetical protein